jgi:hypothetical protein
VGLKIRPWESSQYGSVRQQLKSPLVLQSPPARTKARSNSCLTEPYGESSSYKINSKTAATIAKADV